jgi:protein-disulfide isomerase
MRWNRYLLLSVAVILSAVVLFFFGSVAFNDSTAPKEAAPEIAAAPTPTSLKEPLVTFIDPSRGSVTAKHVIVVYADYACPFCKELNETLGKLFVARPDAFRLVWKNIPNPHYPGSDAAAEAALCAKEQGRFWEYHERLFSTYTSSDVELTLTAADVKLNTDIFGRCLSSHETKAVVERTVAEATALAITGTPFMYLDGKPYDEAMTYEALEEAVR